MQISIHHLAEQELDKSAEYYARSRPDLAKEFLDAVYSAFDDIQENPNASPLLVSEYRRKVIHRFPFSIFYSVKHGAIRVLAIAHQSRRPYYWSGRS